MFFFTFIIHRIKQYFFNFITSSISLMIVSHIIKQVKLHPVFSVTYAWTLENDIHLFSSGSLVFWQMQFGQHFLFLYWFVGPGVKSKKDPTGLALVSFCYKWMIFLSDIVDLLLNLSNKKREIQCREYNFDKPSGKGNSLCDEKSILDNGVQVICDKSGGCWIWK